MPNILLLLLLSFSGQLLAESKPLDEQTQQELEQTIKSDPSRLKAYYFLARAYLGLDGADQGSGGLNINQDLETSGAYYDDALLQLERGETQAAIIQLSNAIKSDPSNLSAYLLLAETYKDQNQYGAAELNYREALRYGADPNLVFLQLGEVLLASEQFEKIFIDLSLSNLPNDLKPGVRVMHGRAYMGTREYGRAEKVLNDAIESDPNLVTARIELARLSVFRGNTGDARKHLDMVSAAGEYLPDYWLISGEIERLEGHDTGALADYSRALELKKDFLLALHAAADLNLRIGDTAAAGLIIADIREFYPEDLRGLLLALTLASQKNAPNELEQLIFDAKAVIDTIDYNKLQEDPYTLIIVGSIHHISGRMTEASSALAQYLEFSPSDLYAVRLLASAQLELQQTTAAIRTLNNASKYYPEDPDLALLYAEALIQQKKYVAALPYLNRFIDNQPNHKEARLQRAKLNASLGNMPPAIAELEALRAQDSDPSIVVTLSNLLLATGAYDRVIALVAETGPQSNGIIDADVIRGKAYIGQGHTAKARAAFSSALMKDPKSASAAYNIALLDLRSGDLNVARKGFKSVLASNPGHRSSLIQLSTMAEKSGNQREAIQYLKDALAIESDVDNHVHLINLLILNQRDQEARDNLTSLRLAYPESLKVMATDAKWNILNENRERASQIYVNMRDQALANKSVDNLVAIARYQLELDDDKNAFDTLDEAQKLDESNLSVLIARAEFKEHEEDYKQALALALEVIRKAPNHPVGYQLKGDIQMDLGLEAQALETYKSGLDNTQANAPLILRYYSALREQSSPKLALDFLEDHVRATSNPDFTILRVIAGAYADAGESAKSIALTETLLKNQPSDPILLNNLALLYFKADDKRAKALAQRAYDLAPDNYAIMDTLGWILVNQNDVSLGVTLLRNALARSANVPEIRYHYAVALHRNGQSSTAKEELRSLLGEGKQFKEIEAARALYKQL